MIPLRPHRSEPSNVCNCRNYITSFPLRYTLVETPFPPRVLFAYEKCKQLSPLLAREKMYFCILLRFCLKIHFYLPFARSVEATLSSRTCLLTRRQRPKNQKAKPSAVSRLIYEKIKKVFRVFQRIINLSFTLFQLING